MKLISIYIFQILFLKTYTRADFKFYHKTEDFQKEFQELSKKCLFQIDYSSQDNELYIIKFKSTSELSLKAFFLFGEHSREMISPELGYHFVQSLCTSYSILLSYFSIQIIVNGNPHSRKKVENGEYCLRVNPNKVDLNRNWDSYWSNDGSNEQSFPGTHAFSEVETVFFKGHNVLTRCICNSSFRRGKYVLPLCLHQQRWFQIYLAEINIENMNTILKQINKEYFNQNCKIGSAEKILDYKCPGTCLDYVYDKLNVKYTYGLEIFDQLQNEVKSDLNLRFNQNTLQTKEDSCFTMFNPLNKKSYDKTIQKWLNVLKYMLEQIYLVEKQKN